MSGDEPGVARPEPLTRRERRNAEDQVKADAEGVEPESGAGESAPERPDEATVVLDRSARAPVGPPVELLDEATVVIERSTGVDDGIEAATIMIERDTARTARDVAMQPGQVPPSSSSSITRQPAENAIYRPRAPQAGPQSPPVVIGGSPPTRSIDPSRPSLTRQARRGSRIVLAVVIGSCVVSVIGLVGVGFAVLG